MKLVVAIDGSSHADRALAWAIDETRVRSASLTVLHAIRVDRLTGPFNSEERHEREHEAALDLVNQALERVDPGSDLRVSVQVPLITGRGVAAALLHNTLDADLVVLGSRGLGGFPGLMLGSVSQQVAAYSRVPVAVVPRATDLDGTQPAIDSVVAGVDGSPSSRRALEWAADEARLREVPLTVVEVQRATRRPDAADQVGDLQIREARLAKEQLRGVVHDTIGTAHDVIIRVVQGNPTRELITHAEKPSSLLVVGSRGHGGFAGLLLGSVSQQCLTHARGPVVVVHA